MFLSLRMYFRAVRRQTQWAIARPWFDRACPQCYKTHNVCGGAVAQLAARLDGIEEVGGSNPPGSTNRNAREAAKARFAESGNVVQTPRAALT